MKSSCSIKRIFLLLLSSAMLLMSACSAGLNTPSRGIVYTQAQDNNAAALPYPSPDTEAPYDDYEETAEYESPEDIYVITADDLGSEPAGVVSGFFGMPDYSCSTSAYSDTISYVEYWSEGYMEITFKSSGSTYTYANVPLWLYQELIESESPGSYYNENIKGKREYFIEGYG